MNQPKPKQKFLPLREVVLTSRPLVKRALAFSCDGELAVAADDSVHVLVPEFPDLPGRRAQKERGEQIEDSPSEDEENGFESYRNKTRAQYSEGSKHMPVSYPPLDPRINKELFATAGLPFPYDLNAGVEDGSEEEDSEAIDSEDEDGEPGLNGSANRPFGAGYGPITGVGSSMNHVVRMAWSPSGLGVNLRPILAILTSAGVVAMYGDGGKLDNVLPRANEGMLQRREISSWIVLWGVGERLMVPGQQVETTENLQGMAWAKEIAPGQALLATINDVREVAIISVQSIPTMEESKARGNSSTGGTGEVLEWLVHEVVRFKAEGPHPKIDVLDPDWTPCGTSFGLSWSPWVVDDDSSSALLSFIDRNYVGFRRIIFKEPWVRGEIPKVYVSNSDSAGRCVHLSTDAFLEFEDAVWTEESVSSCRGLIVTPFNLMPFEVAISPEGSSNLAPHTTRECGTVYPEALDSSSENPIVDLVIHPPDTSGPPQMPIPFFTLIRLSATSTNHDWYETNVPPAPNAADPLPQWARDISQKLEIAIPADMYLKRTYGDDGDSEGGSEDEDSDPGSISDNDAFEDDNPVPQGPEIHPHRFRLHGLVSSPGGGATAVIASTHNTQHPERGGWHTVRSSVYFGYKRRRREAEDQPFSEPQMSNLTVEARLFEYLYGGGPPVPGINAPNTEHYELDDTTRHREQQRARLREIFRTALANQTCDLCGTRMMPHRTKGQNVGLTKCEKGHFFGTCGTSGLAVQMPGITRSCGTCGLRSIRATVLMKKVPDRAEEILREVGDGLCGGCGGKFLN